LSKKLKITALANVPFILMTPYKNSYIILIYLILIAIY